MSNELQLALSFLGVGALLPLIGVIVGAFLMFRGSKVAPGQGEGFLKGPKGDVFTVQDKITPFAFDAPTTEPNPDEEHILKKTDKFLESFGGGE